MIPYANVTLTEIDQPGSAPNYDEPGTAGTPRGTGSLGCYVADQVVEVESAGRVDELVKTRIEIPWAVGSLVQRGDTLRWTHRETGVAWTRVAEDVSGTRLVGRVRILLEDA
jgi:hypothetical protein